MRHLIFIALLFGLVGCGNSSSDAIPENNDEPAPNDDPVTLNSVTSNNYVNVLQNSLDLLRGRHYQELVGVLGGGAETVWGAPFSHPSGELLASNCPGGGEFSRTEFYEDNTTGPISANLVELELMQCAIGGAVISGSISINSTTEAARQGSTFHTHYTFSNLTINTDEVQQSLSATLAQSSGTYGFQQSFTIEFRTSSYVRQTGATRLSLTDSVYRQEYDHQQDTNNATTDHHFQEEGSGILLLGGTINFGGSIEMNPALVYLNEPVENNPNWTHTENLASGNLTVTSIDGSFVQVSPDTGNDGTVNYLISSDGFQTLVEDFWFTPAPQSLLP